MVVISLRHDLAKNCARLVDFTSMADVTLPLNTKMRATTIVLIGGDASTVIRSEKNTILYSVSRNGGAQTVRGPLIFHILVASYVPSAHSQSERYFIVRFKTSGQTMNVGTLLVQTELRMQPPCSQHPLA